MFRRTVLTACLSSALLCLSLSAPAIHAEQTPLHDGWTLQSACKLQDDGAAISKNAYKPQGWFATPVPATVMAVQVASGAIKDPYYGMNMREIPGGDYPYGKVFSRLPMPQDSPYRCGWWYRKTFAVPATDKGKTLSLHFGGINYRANIWVNGKQIADDSKVAGAYRTYDFDVTANLVTGQQNTVAVETFAPTENDLGINWVDWNPAPPDKDMGLWGGVSLVTDGPVALRSPLVTTHFTDDTLKEADLSVYAELHNATDRAIHGKINGTVAGVRIEQSVDLAPNEDKSVAFSPEQYAQLKVKNPRVWWPYMMGKPNLETATLRFTEDGRISDEQTVRFGIREVTSDLTDKGYRLFKVNDKPILIRGAGWSQDMLLRENPDRLRDQLKLVKDMHLNTIRLEGKLETEDFFHQTDEQGILVMLGWCCCDRWEQWDKWTPETMDVAKASLTSQMLRLRSHASLLVWLNGSDNPPPANVESAYLAIEQQTHWPNPTISSASAKTTSVTGKSGVKMSGPYDYVGPSYWLTDPGKAGGAFGFNTETGPGPAPPQLSSLKKFMPSDQVWPPSKVWQYHSGIGEFAKMDIFNSAMKTTYGSADAQAEYLRIAQTMTYDAERAMFEAYGRNKYTSTGVIQWMLNNAWPSMIWHLYDYYLDTGGGYFGTKKACEPLHIQYSYDDRSVYVINSTYEPASHLEASVKVYDLKMKEEFAQADRIDVAADGAQKTFAIPESAFAADSSVHFVLLELKDAAGKLVSRNFYWLPQKPTVWDWEKSNWLVTLPLKPEDMSALRSLPAAHIEAESHLLHSQAGETVEVRLHNPSKALAFQVAVAAKSKDGEDITPVLWSDNYVELLPGESMTLTAQLPQHVAGASIEVSGWNINSSTLRLASEVQTASR
ncbi:glycosyl hydrolase 2 galactose-binding domain-containing protein [Silvibacterium acidisoli]|uniref:glycosyl hydrolase 2 galactose-binding domain-containing protein n=1 Tax=Acidobacteriaceae bacterium ZG23-2 TaxID=2883246 RepID=UPI00406D2EF8